jgi:hypothetical protein
MASYEAAEKNMIVPRGVAVWPSLQKPDEKFNKYKTGVRVQANAKGVPEFIGACDNFLADWMESEGIKAKKGRVLVVSPPYEILTDDDDNPTGEVLIKCARTAIHINKVTGEKYDFKPIIEDSKGNLVTKQLNIGNGSVLQVGAEARTYLMEEKTGDVAGFSLRPKRVRLFSLVARSGTDNFSEGFEKDEEGDGFDSTGGDFTADSEGTPGDF